MSNQNSDLVSKQSLDVFEKQQPDLVSIIIPVYNTGAYLRETLDSCLNQTYANIEVLAMDDHSKDKETLEILQSYAQKDPRVRVIRSQENHGVIYGRNKGVELAQGKYFAFLDHDDLLAPDFVERLRQAIIDYDADLAESSFQPFMDCESKEEELDDYRLAYVKSNAESFAARKSDLVIFNRQDIINTGYVFNMTKLCWAKLFVTEKYRKAGLRFEDVRYGEDVDWSVRVFTSLERFVGVRFQGLFYRLHTGAGSSGSKGFFKGINESWRRIYDLVCQREDLKPLANMLVKELLDYKYYAYRLLGECANNKEQQVELRYLLDLYRYCGFDAEKMLREHHIEQESAQIWYPFYTALKAKSDLPCTLVVAFNSLFDLSDEDNDYCVELLHQLGLQGMGIHVLTTDLSSSQHIIPAIKKLPTPLGKCTEYGYVVGNRQRQLVHGCSEYTVVEFADCVTTPDGRVSLGLSESQRFMDVLQRLLVTGKFQNIVVVGREQLTESIGQQLNFYRLSKIKSGSDNSDSNSNSNFNTNSKSHGGLNQENKSTENKSTEEETLKPRLIQWVLGSNLSEGEIESGKVKESAWADKSISFLTQGALIPSYARSEVDFAKRQYITIVGADCEQGLAIAIQLVMLMKKRCPEQKFMVVQRPQDNLVGQLQKLHSSDGQKLFSLRPDLSNLKTSEYPHNFSEIWAESKVLLQLAPRRPNCTSLSLEALYNYVPVISTMQSHKPSVGTVSCKVPEETKSDPSCLPDDLSCEEFLVALERVLLLSEAEVKASCNAVIEQYQQQNHLANWLDVLTGDASKGLY